MQSIQILNQSHEIIAYSESALELIEIAGRTCYKSEDKITKGSAEKFIQLLICNGHEAMIEFADVTVKFITNRGVSHELVRHRLCSFAQESTRYVNYSKRGIEFIKPVWIGGENVYDLASFIQSLEDSANAYFELISKHYWRPEQAREVLPNALKTEIVVKANMREWRHILKLRCSKKAHPQMRALMLPLLKEMKEKFPQLFEDIPPLFEDINGDN